LKGQQWEKIPTAIFIDNYKNVTLVQDVQRIKGKKDKKKAKKEAKIS
jgi:hypothetical protein